jgi:hypothetical protein
MTTILNAFIQIAISEFHIYAVDWRIGSIKVYIDNNLVPIFLSTANYHFNLFF